MKYLKMLFVGVLLTFSAGIMTGCGEEQAMWERIKRNLIDN